MAQVVGSSRIPVFSLGERIRKAREDQGLSQAEFAIRLGVDRKTVSNWEGSRNQPRYGDLMLIASVTDVNLPWLAGDLFRPTESTHGRSVVGEDVDNSQGTVRDTPRYAAVA